MKMNMNVNDIFLSSSKRREMEKNKYEKIELINKAFFPYLGNNGVAATNGNTDICINNEYFYFPYEEEMSNIYILNGIAFNADDPSYYANYYKGYLHSSSGEYALHRSYGKRTISTYALYGVLMDEQVFNSLYPIVKDNIIDSYFKIQSFLNKFVMKTLNNKDLNVEALGAITIKNGNINKDITIIYLFEDDEYIKKTFVKTFDEYRNKKELNII